MVTFFLQTLAPIQAGEHPLSVSFFRNLLVLDVVDFSQMNWVVSLDLFGFKYFVHFLVAQFHGFEVNRIIRVQVDREVVFVEDGAIETGVSLSHASFEDFETSKPHE